MSISSGPSAPWNTSTNGTFAYSEVEDEDDAVNGIDDPEDQGGEEEEEEIDQLEASEPEDEEDELAGDTQLQPSVSNAPPRAPRRYRRVPGTTCIPAAKVENILQADGIMGSLSFSKEGSYILSVATEEFIKRLAQGGHRQANSGRRNAINYRDMADTTRQYQEFMFLKDIIPYPVTVADAFELRQAFFKDGDAPPSALPSRSVSAPNAKASTSKSKSSTKQQQQQTVYTAVNGTTSVMNGRSSTFGGQVLSWGINSGVTPSYGYNENGHGQPAHTGAGVLDNRPWTHWQEPAPAPTNPPSEASSSTTSRRRSNVNTSPQNHHTTPTNVDNIPPPPPPAAVVIASTSNSSISPEPNSAEAPSSSVTPSLPTPSPVGGFLQGPGQQNTGRTIYSTTTPATTTT